MTRRNLLLMLLIFVASITKAHDFEIDGIYYEHMSRADMTVAVSCKGNSWDASEEYSGNVVVPYTVTHNGEHYKVAAVRSYAFMGNTKLTSVSLPFTVKSIGEYAFSQNTGTLHSIELPSTLENIKEYAFGTVEKVTSSVLSPLPVSTDAFYSSTFSNAPLYVPAGTAGKYKSAEGWKKFYKIVEIAGTGIDEATVSAAEPYAVFDANGRRTNALKRGLNILRYGDGTVKKVIKK